MPNFILKAGQIARRCLIVVPLFASVSLSTSLVSSAAAAVTRFPLSPPASPITGAGSGVAFEAPGRLAIDEGSTNLFLGDGREAIDIVGSENGTPSGLIGPFQIVGFNFEHPENGIAFDNVASSPNKGTLYVVAGIGGAINKYVRDPNQERYVAAGQIVDNLPGFRGDQPAGATVDSQGDLWVGDLGSQSVAKFNASGTLEASYDLASEGGPTAVAVDSAGDLFVVGGTRAYKFPANGSGGIDPSNHVEFVSGGANALAYDPQTNSVMVAIGDRVAEYNATDLGRTSEFGAGTLSGATGIAIDSSRKRVYVAEQNPSGTPNVVAFGPAVAVPTPLAFAATNVTATKATLNGSVNLEGVAETGCKFEYGLTASYGQSASCSQAVPADFEPHPVSAEIGGLAPSGTIYHYRLVASNTNGSEATSDRTFATGTSTTTEPATSVGISSAVLNGIVRPEGSPFSECSFEWGVTTHATFEHVETECAPAAAAIDPDFAAHAVTAALQGLQPNTTYKFRLVTKAPAGIVRGAVRTFTTSGGPQISDVRAQGATQGSVILEAEINPSGFPTSYRFEWGSNSGYGAKVPAEFDPAIGGGNQPVLVTAEVSGLTAARRYHYRVVARSGAGGAAVTTSPDQEFETLNSCGLPDGRCLEMVSPPGVRLVALPQESTGLELSSQAAEAPGLMEFQTELGFPGTEVGGENLYLANRTSGEWQSSQYTPSMTGAESGGNQRSRVLGFSRNLDCSVIASSSALTDDPAGRTIERVGGANLYRRGSGEDYTLITNLPPETLEPEQGPTVTYRLAGMSQDCRRVVFSTKLHYPGVPGIGERRLYEWNNGSLSNVGRVPHGTGEKVAEATVGSAESNVGATNTFNPVSADASRVFFTATSQAGDDEGNQAVFARIDGSETLDVSQSSVTADTGADFQGATPDGSRVYFTANSGLTEVSSPSGRDLYECHIVVSSGSGKPECELADLSVGATGEPAEVGARTPYGFIGALVGVSDDGSHVYFVARGQLVPGQGASEAENIAGDALSLYLHETATDHIRYVGAVDETDLRGVATAETGFYTSRVSANGRYLLFESSANVTGYNSGHSPVAYIFDAEASDPENSVSCVSCRQDGRPPVGSVLDAEPVPLLARPGENVDYWPQSLVERDGRPVVFFRSRDPLAPGASESEWNLYEWAHNQVFRIASDLHRGEPAGYFDRTLDFLGASREGTDLYFVGATALTWEDPDARKAVWDARVEGGFAQPPSVPECDAASEGACQGSPPSVSGTAGSGTSGFFGPGNVTTGGRPKSPKKRHKRHHRKKHHKKMGAKKSEKRPQSRGRRANSNGRSAK